MCHQKKTMLYVFFSLKIFKYSIFLSFARLFSVYSQFPNHSLDQRQTVSSWKMRFHENISPWRRGVVGVALGVAEGSLTFDRENSPILILNGGRVVSLPPREPELPFAADGSRLGDVYVGRGRAEGELVGSRGVWVEGEIPGGRVEGAPDDVDLVLRLEVGERGGGSGHLVARYAAAAVQVGLQLVHRLLRELTSLKFQYKLTY